MSDNSTKLNLPFGASGFTIIGLDTGETTTASALRQTQYSTDAEL